MDTTKGPSLRYGDRTVQARKGERLLDAILRANPEHRHLCGGRGFCTTCRVEVLAGASSLSPVTRVERERLGRLAGAIRLACQSHINGPLHVRVPRPAPPRFPPDGE